MTENKSITAKNLRKQILTILTIRPKLLKYLLKNANSKIMQKFHRCCKQFYKEAPYFIVDSFVSENTLRIENEEYHACIDFMDPSQIEPFLRKIDNIWVTKTVSVRRLEILWKIVRCSAKEVTIDTNIYFTEFQFLTRSGNVEKLIFERIFYNATSNVTLEDIFAQVPNISAMTCGGCCVNPLTMDNLNMIQLNQKIKHLILYSINGKFDSKSFFEFVKVNIFTLSYFL